MATTFVPHRWKYDVFELVKILECKQIEFPRYEVQIIFYDVKPDVVRKQTECYAEAFARHQVSNRPEVDNWKEALSMAANLSGWDLQDMTNGYEYKFIDCISKDILKKLCDGPLHVGENLVGIDIHFDKLDLSRFVRSDKVNMIGICGISGIGKTTLAKAIYNLMYIPLKNLLCSMVIKQRMACKPILLVLDDVDHRDQLKALVGSASWFCPGSLIIVTGKDRQMLRSHRVDEIHDMKFLDKDQSLQLFSFYAFEEKHPSTGFQALAEKAVKYLQGHPLALIVLGCFLYSKTVGQWVSEPERLRGHPNEEIHRVLRLSYDGLNFQQQNILLDIACLFIGEKVDFVASVLDGCNFFADTNMQVLVDKSLITISSNMSLQMHDLIQVMARAILHEESIMHGKKRRLLISSNIYNISGQNKVATTKAVEVLVVSLEKYSQKVHIDANDFSHMKKLRILKIYQKEERFEQKHELKGHNSFRRLKVVKLSYCNLVQVPESIGGLSCLKNLNLEGNNLFEVPISIGGLSCLVDLNLKWNNLLEVPESIGGLLCLEDLNLEGNNLLKVPESIGGLSCLVDLNLKGNNLLEVPESIGGLSCLEDLILEGNNFTILPGSLSQLSQLGTLELDGCKKLEVLPELPPRVWNISAVDCTSLREVLGSSKDHMRNDFSNCPKLFKNVTINSEGSISKTQSLDSSITSQGFIHQLSAFLGYLGIHEFFLQDNVYSVLDILYYGNSMPEWFTNRSRENHVKVELPSDLSYDKNFRGFGTCVVFKYKKPFSIFEGFSVKNFDGAFLMAIDFFSHVFEEFFFCVNSDGASEIGIRESCMIWLHYTKDTRRWNGAKNFVTFSLEENNEDVEVKECGVRLVCDEDIQQEAHLSMFQGLPTPTQHGGKLSVFGVNSHLDWSW
ncbi:NB-ARC domains-containing protein [Tanacetum coccineum]